MSFDLLAPHYRWMEFFLAGKKLQRCRTAFLDQIPTPQNILLLGEGHGRCLVECQRQFPNARITCIDASQRMLDQARRQLARRGLKADRVKFIHADVFEWDFSKEIYDLIITNFFLDCFRADQLAEIVARISVATNRETNWLVADFQSASAGFRRVRSRIVLRAMYLFFRAFTRLSAKQLTPPDLFLQSSGFTLHRRIESEWELLHADWWKRGGECY